MSTRLFSRFRVVEPTAEAAAGGVKSPREALNEQWLRIRAGLGVEPAIDSMDAVYQTELRELRSAEIQACAIVDEATDELLTLANAGAQWVGGGRAMVALGGPLLSKGTALRRRLEKRDEDHGAGLDLRDPEGSPLEGAIRLGVTGTLGPYRDLIHLWHRESA